MGGRFRVLIASAGVAATGVAAACGSFSEANEAETKDASTDDPASSDAPFDAGPTGDATVGGGWSVVFQDDFANGIGAWNWVTNGSGMLAPLDGGFGAGVGTSTGIAYLARQPVAPIQYSELRVDFHVFPGKLGLPFPCVVTLQPGPGKRPSVRLQPTPSGPTLHHELKDTGFVDHPYTGQLVSGQWTTVSMEVRFGTSPSARVSYGGVDVLNVPLTEELPVIAQPQVGIGIICDETSAEFIFDDVALYRR